MNRAIHIFPPESVSQKINQIRQRFDPLYTLIDPHITLVFPFESDLSESDLNNYIEHALKDMSPFQVVLQGITGTNDGFLFLNVKVGNDPIISLHDRLYTGPLKPFLNRSVTYIPHLTVGKCLNKTSFEAALAETETVKETFELEVNAIAVEEIETGGKSRILSKFVF